MVFKKHPYHFKYKEDRDNSKKNHSYLKQELLHLKINSHFFKSLNQLINESSVSRTAHPPLKIQLMNLYLVKNDHGLKKIDHEDWNKNLEPVP